MSKGLTRPFFLIKAAHLTQANSLYEVRRVTPRHPTVIAPSERGVGVPLSEHIIVQSKKVSVGGSKTIVDTLLLAV